MRPVYLGWTGFNGGTKPAVSLARVQRPREEDPEEPARQLRMEMNPFNPRCFSTSPELPGFYALWNWLEMGTSNPTVVAQNEWESVRTDGFHSGTLYSASDCNEGSEEGGYGPSEAMTFSITLDPDTDIFTINGYMTGWGGSELVWNGSGPIDTAISNTITDGTITLSYAS